jgi:hypothetical protein
MRAAMLDRLADVELQHGHSAAAESVELDALEPAVLAALLRDAIERHIDGQALAVMQAAEASERDVLLKMLSGLAGGGA